MAAFAEKTDELTLLPQDGLAGLDVFDAVGPSVKALGKTIQEAGRSGLPILISGEPGTGKRVLALAIHQQSGRPGLTLVEVECDEHTQAENRGIPANQFFAQTSTGETGTVLFHEVGSLDPAGQAQLRQLLTENASNLDGNRAKLMFTSHRNLEHEIRLGRFREDLYYEISKVCVRIPPLRYRREEILPLAERFVAKYAALMNRPKPSLSESTLKFLLEYSWPGNARELEDAARTIAAIGDDRVAVAALRSTQKSTRKQNGRVGVVSLKDASRAASRAAEKELILKVLSRTQWNRKRAAEELKISYKALLYKLKQIGMHEPDSAVERDTR